MNQGNALIIFRSIKETLAEVCQETKNLGITSNREWTDCIYAKFFALCQSYGKYHCCCSRVPHTEPEWLFDMLWYEYDKNGMLVSIPFVMESEWALDKVSVKYDYEKLLVAKADFKLLITQLPQFKDSFVSGITAFSKHDYTEFYMLSYWTGGTTSRFESFLYDGNGNLVQGND